MSAVPIVSAAVPNVPAVPVVEFEHIDDVATVEVAKKVVVSSAIPTTMNQKCERYSSDMHAYTTLQSDAAKLAAKVAIASRGPFVSANSNSSLTSTISSGSEVEPDSPFPITKA